MGKNKRVHIGEMLEDSEVQNQWILKHGSAPTEKSIDLIYDSFMPLQIEAVKINSDPIPGAVDVINKLIFQGVKVGGTTGYNKEIMDVVHPLVSSKGLNIEVYEAGIPDGSNGRPKPWMALTVLQRLNAYPVGSCVKVDDTITGIHEGLNAGMWTIGVTGSGNEMGLRLHEFESLSAEEKEVRTAANGKKMLSEGAHYVISTVADLLPVLAEIDQRIANGEVPPRRH